MTPVAVIGTAQSKHAASRDDANYMELTFEVVQDLLAKTGWSHDRIGTVINASSDFLDGRTISDIAVQDSAGAAGKSASKVSMDGTFALVYAAARICSGCTTVRTSSTSAVRAIRRRISSSSSREG